MRGAARGGTMIVGLVLAAVVAVPAAGQEWRVQATECDRSRGWDGDRERWCEVRETRFGAVGGLEVAGGVNGGIEVVGWDRDEVEVVVRVHGHADDEERARSIVDEIEIRIDDGRIRAEGPRRDRRGEGWGVSYEIRVPHSTDLDLSTTNGGVALEGVGGDIDFRTTNGGVRLLGVEGDVRGRTTNGGIHVALSGERWSGDGLDVETTNGGVVVEVPEGYSADLETGTTNGSIELDFPVMVQGRVGRELRTELGEGGAPLRIRTTNGNVEIRRR